MSTFGTHASKQALTFFARQQTEFVFGSAARHPHAPALGRYSVHTSAKTLGQGEARIREVGQQLRAAGRLP